MPTRRYITNPETGRKVLRNGPTGKKILEARKKGHSKRKPAKKSSRKKASRKRRVTYPPLRSRYYQRPSYLRSSSSRPLRLSDLYSTSPSVSIPTRRRTRLAKLADLYDCTLSDCDILDIDSDILDYDSDDSDFISEFDIIY